MPANLRLLGLRRVVGDEDARAVGIDEHHVLDRTARGRLDDARAASDELAGVTEIRVVLPALDLVVLDRDDADAVPVVGAVVVTAAVALVRCSVGVQDELPRHGRARPAPHRPNEPLDALCAAVVGSAVGLRAITLLDDRRAQNLLRRRRCATAGRLARKPAPNAFVRVTPAVECCEILGTGIRSESEV